MRFCTSRRRRGVVAVHTKSRCGCGSACNFCYGATTCERPWGGETPSVRRHRDDRADAAFPMRGKERAFEGSATVRNGGSVVVAAAAAWEAGGCDTKSKEVQSAARRRAASERRALAT